MPQTSSNPYDNIILPLVGEEKKAKAGGYDAIIPQQEAEDPAMRASVSLAVDTNPALFAAQRRNARAAGLPPAAGSALPEEAKRLATVDTIVKDTEHTPVLRQRYTDADFAKLSHTDSGVLAGIEKTIGKGVAFVMGANPEANLPDILRAGGISTMEGAAGAFQMATGAATLFPGPLDLLPGGNPFARLSEGFGFIADDARKSREKLAASWGDTWQGQVFGGGLESGIQSAVQNVPIMLGTAALVALGAPVATTVTAGLLMMAAGQGGMSYSKDIVSGAGKATSLIHGAGDAVAEYVGEKYWGFGGFMERALVGSSLTKLFVYELAREVPGEIGTTLVQNFNAWAANNQNKSFADYLLAQPVAVAQTIVATLVGGAAQIGGAHVGQGLMAEAARTAGLTDKAKQGASHLDDLFARAKESELRTHEPVTFGELMQAMADANEGAVKVVYVDAQTLLDMAASANVSQEVFNQLLPSAGPQMQEALTAGGTVELPIGEVLANIPGSKLEPGFIDNTRITPASLTRAEIALVSEEAQAYWQTRADEVLKQAENAQAVIDSADVVRQEVVKQLDATKRFKPEVAQRYADLHAAFFTVLASRLGVTPEQAFQKYGASIRSTLGEGQAYRAPRKPGEITVEGVHYSKEARNTLSGAMYGTNIAGSGKEAFLAAKDQRLRNRIYFYANKGTGINPEAGVGGFAHKANLTNIYDANSDPLRLRKGDQQAFESAVLDRGYSGYLDRLEGTQSAQVILLGDQNVPVSQMDASQKAEAAPVPAPAARESKGRDLIVDKLAADKTLPAGSPSLARWQEILPADVRDALAEAGLFDGDQSRTMYKSELAAAYAAATEAPVYGQTVSTRTPKPKAGRADPHLSTGLAVDIETLNTVPKFKEKLAGVVAKYIVMKPSRAGVDKQIETFIEQAKDNLLWLFDKVDPQTRERSKLWYVGGRAIVDRWVAKYNGRYTDAQMAGALAAESPKMAWDINVSLSERITDIYTYQQETAWDDAMTAVADKVAEKNPNRVGVIDAVRGKKLNELASPTEKAFWIRFYDEAHNPRTYRLVTPEGGFLPENAKVGSGADATAAYGNGFEPIAKVVSILEDGSIPNISRQLGEAHKVRNFYNNLFDPSDPKSVTIDTHAVAAALLLPLGASSVEVNDALGGAGSNDATGMSGTYVLLAEAYRRAAAERGVLPRELQSITWEAVRGLFSPAFKTAHAKDSTAIDSVWAAYRRGKVTIDEARQQILELAGGITPPRWTKSSSGLHEGAWASSYTGDLLGPELAGRGARPDAGGTRSGDTTGVPEVLGQRGATGPVLLNVGLDIPAGGQLTPAEVQAAIEAFGVKVESSAVHKSDTEQTFVGQLDRALTPDEADALSRALGQEAVVQMVGNEGALYGPEKEKWGDFNPDYFLTLKGDRASAALNQSAFHGTPHRFDKFSTEHIGRGEGAQAYGWGLYFASKKEIAEHYRKNLLIAKGVDLWTDELRAQLPPTRTKAESEEFNNLNIKLIRNSNLPPGEMVRWRELKNIATVRDEAIARLQPKGQLYEVDIPEDDTLLLWDKPLSEQPEKVREALKQVGVSFPEYALDTKRASSDFYLYIGDKLNSDKAASETLLAAGVRGIKYLDGTSRRAGAGSYNYVVFSGDDVAIKNQFYQNKPDPLGTFKPSTLEISLLADANLSTFLHETGHFFLEVLGRVANEPGAPKEVVDDLNATLKWFGVKDIETWNAMTFDEREPHHEKWAESFERYLLEGKAPSLALRQSFQRFKEFLIGAYRSLKQFIAGHPEAKLNDEVRSVFDRLLATEEQIKEAEAQARFEEIFKSAKDAGMTEEEWKAYQEKHQDATQAALEKMGKLSLADTKWFVAARSKALREAQAAVADKRAEMKAQVTAEVMALPVEQARAEIANLRASTPEQKAALKAWNEARAAALTQAKEQLTAALVAANPDAKGLDKGQLIAKNKRAIANQAEAKALEWEQSHPRPKTMPPPLEMEVLAERLGYTSADQLRREMIEAPAAKDLIEAMTDQRLLETYGNLVTREGIEQAANEAVYNEARGRFVATELGAMQDAMSKTGPSGKTNRAGKPINVNVITQAARTFAEAVVNRRRIMDLKPAQHTAAAARAAGKAAKLQAEGKTAEAIAAKRDQLLSHFTALYAFRAEKDVAQQLAYLKKFDKEGVRKSIPQDYLDQIDALLERVDLRKGTSAKEIGRRQDLAAWVEQQHEEGKSPILPPAALANSQLTSYKEMTVEDFAGLVDSIQNIEHLGRLKGKLLKSADKRAWDAIATEIADTIRKFGGKARPDSLEPRGPLTQLAAGFWADHRKLDSLAYQMDGGQLNGPMFRAFIRGMNDSGAFKASEIAKATEALARIYSPVWALPGGTAGDLKFIPEINNSLTRGGRLSVALNWGNAENRQRLLETGVGAPWSQAQVEAIMRTLSPTELQFVNNVWEFLDSFWPAVKAKQQRVSGVVEEKVEAVPFDVVASDGTPVHMRGGYYPIVYDNDRSNAAAKRDALQIAKDMLRGAIGAATTRRGHTKARVEEVKAQPLRLSLNVITQHVEQVVHDLAWHEWLIDANKILADKRIAAAIREHYGPAILKTMRENVKGIATGDLTSQTSLDQILLKLKSNLSRAVMGYSMTTALLQPFGVLQSVSRVGVAPILKGAGRWAGDAARMESSLTWIHEKSDFMRLRSQTMNREINDISQRVRGKSKTMQVIDHSLFVLMQKMQTVADVPTWIGMYERAQAEGYDEATSVALADEAVKASQGSGQPQDLANVQRKHPFLTMFYSYFSTTLNLVAEKTAMTDFKSPTAVAGWMADMALLVTLPAILPNLLAYVMKGGDDDDPEGWAKRLAKWQASYLLGLFVGLRELSGAVEGFDYAGPPVGRVLVDLTKTSQQLLQGELDEAAVTSIARTMGDIFGIPAAQLIRSYKGWQAWADGDAPITAVLMGPPPRD